MIATTFIDGRMSGRRARGRGPRGARARSSRRSARSPRASSRTTTSRTGVPARTLALGGGEYLRVELPTRVERRPAASTTSRPRSSARRASCARSAAAGRSRGCPRSCVAPGGTPPSDRITERIEHFLRGARRASTARPTRSCTRGTQLVGAAREPDELEASRWPFLARRALATHAPGSSHGEVVDPDAYAMSFWYDAALVVLLAEPYARRLRAPPLPPGRARAREPAAAARARSRVAGRDAPPPADDAVTGGRRRAPALSRRAATSSTLASPSSAVRCM